MANSPVPPPDPGRTDILVTPGLTVSGELEPGATGLLDSGTIESAALPQLPIKIGRYRVDREIARGGMGVVLAARDPELGREVAIKVLLEAHAGKPIYRQWFRDEARITAQLQHPGVVPVFELGELEDSRPFFVMRYVPGQTLESLLAARKNPADKLPQLIAIFEQICQTVAYAHSQSLIHCDLKPLNIMVAPFGIVKVMDWGLAIDMVAARGREQGRAAEHAANTDTALTSTPPPAEPTAGQGIGTPAYLAPEQAQRDITLLDRRTDVFGLGGILCAILTGQPPYPGHGTRRVYKRAAHGDLGETFARHDTSGAACELVALAKACLSPNPCDRPRDAVAVVVALTAYLQSDMRRAEHDLLRFFELTPDLFCIAGIDGYFRRVNANFTRVLGYSPEELISRPFIEFVHPDDRASTAAEAEKLSRGLPVVYFRNRYRDTRGGYRWFEWAAKSIPDEGIIFAVARDITDRVELEASLRGKPEVGPM